MILSNTQRSCHLEQKQIPKRNKAETGQKPCPGMMATYPLMMASRTCKGEKIMENELMINLFDLVESYRVMQKRNMWSDFLWLDIIPIWWDFE